MTKTLQRLGYKVFPMENPSPIQVRRKFEIIKSYVQRHRVKTFLFYYSGHAGKHSFHLGIKRGSPLSYREFLDFFLQLSVKRRFAILDACHGGEMIPMLEDKRFKKGRFKKSVYRSSVNNNKAIFQSLNRRIPRSKRFNNLDQLRLWYTLRLPKGVRRPKKAFDFSKTPFLRRENGAGIQIIGTIGVAWHHPTMRASLLTTYLLRGLRGAADNVKDGRITLAELYNFAEARLRRKNQKLNHFRLFNGNYTLAPNYQSSMHLASAIRGSIQVSIGEFAWHYRKRDARRIAIPTIHGKGIVEIEIDGRCWHQIHSFPKGGNVEIDSYGVQAPCHKRVPKGSIVLQAQSRTLPQKPSQHSISFSLGFTQLGQASVATSHPVFAVGYHYRFVGIEINYHLGQAPIGKSFVLHRLSLTLEGGIPLSLDLNGKLVIFLGAIVRTGLVLVDLTAELRQVLSSGVGARVAFQYWLFPRIGFRLGFDAGLDYTPLIGLSGLSFQWEARFAFLLRI